MDEPSDLIARVEARWSHRIRVAARRATGRPLRRYPRPSWTPLLLVLGAVAVAAAMWILITAIADVVTVPTPADLPLTPVPR